MDIYRKEIPGVDIFKYVMAIAVIAIHVSACSDGEIFPIVQRWFDSLAVPFFFFVSGFFLARKISGVTSVSDKSNIIRKRSIEAFSLFIIWALLYFPISLSITLTDAPDLIKVIPRMTVRLLIQGEMPYAWPLWFLYSMAWITLAVSYVINKPKFKFVLIITVVLFYLGYFFKREYGICEISTYISILYKLLPFRVLGGGCIFAGRI